MSHSPRKVPEIVIPTRSSSIKRAGDPSTSRLSSPAKRSRVSEDGSPIRASSSSSVSRPASAYALPLAASGSNGSPAKRSGTPIGRPKTGDDIVTPTRQRSSQSASSSSVQRRSNGHSERSGITQVSVSRAAVSGTQAIANGSRRSQEGVSPTSRVGSTERRQNGDASERRTAWSSSKLGASTSTALSFNDGSGNPVTASPSPSKPKEARSSKRRAIGDLMSRPKTSANVEIEGREQDKPIIALEQRESRSKPNTDKGKQRLYEDEQLIVEETDEEMGHPEATDEGVHQDHEMVMAQATSARTRSISPPRVSAGRDSDTMGSAVDRTPTKKRASHRDVLLTTPKSQARPILPASSTKKKTLTKAIKPSVEETQAVLTTELLLTPTKEKTATTSPLRSAGRPQSTRTVRQLQRKDALDVLSSVLQRLSGPTAVLSHELEKLGEDLPRPGSAEYKSWLAGRPCLSPAHEAAERDVRSTMDRTIREGEGNCLLLVGERGIGKTAIIDRANTTLSAVYGEDGFLVIRLSGLVQRDDKSALKEVARQLCSSSFAEDAEGEEGSTSFTSNANILSSLLLLLEPGPSDDETAASNKAKPLIFVIDEFDLFAHHSVRQSFLYCLLDCVQGGFRRGGMAVFGLSARADCIETLEKRVKSRCQSRVHHILPSEDIFTGTVETLKGSMTLGSSESSEVIQSWNEGIDLFFSDKNAQIVLTAMNELRGLDAENKLFDTFATCIATSRRQICNDTAKSVSSDALLLKPSDLTPFVQLPERSIPSSLTIVEIAMLIACKHVVEEERPLNFVIAYERYAEHSKRAAASGNSSSRAFTRGLCLKAYERLRKLGILREVASSAKGASAQGGGGSIFKLCRLVPWPSFIEYAVKERQDVPQHLVKWCKAWSA